MKQIIVYFAFLIINSTSIFSQNILISDVSVNAGYSYPLGKYREVPSIACAGLDSKGAALPHYVFSLNGNIPIFKSIKIALLLSYFENKINNKQIYENCLKKYNQYSLPVSGNWKNFYFGIGPAFEKNIHKNIIGYIKIHSGFLKTIYPETKIYWLQNADNVYAEIKSKNSISPFFSFGIGSKLRLIDGFGLIINTDWLYSQQKYILKSDITNIKSKQSINTLNTTIGLIYFL